MCQVARWCIWKFIGWTICGSRELQRNSTPSSYQDFLKTRSMTVPQAEDNCHEAWMHKDMGEEENGDTSSNYSHLSAEPRMASLLTWKLLSQIFWPMRHGLSLPCLLWQLSSAKKPRGAVVTLYGHFKVGNKDCKDHFAKIPVPAESNVDWWLVNMFKKASSWSTWNIRTLQMKRTIHNSPSQISDIVLMFTARLKTLGSHKKEPI